ncbi:hypothetical protein HETIRDRAFT_106560 [Heterobasidion irregulare TC 32-1]|uniref:Uncharacterized protein n=1 Tax=Heterobasidion irregulare (strain TC 32-1) TaxID=747525 RepID=W4JS41_HETIT|nr:uncharacterized protein HETIRDRAFT_106560 [Heterobasidion irregulare TC 32-1]ETW75920.1 hypothetical protein HETIRDRAFT_106560 [Heterobasidion irregulare TC 32-1]
MPRAPTSSTISTPTPTAPAPMSSAPNPSLPPPDKYRGAVIEDLQLPPAFALPQDEGILAQSSSCTNWRMNRQVHWRR